MTEHRANSNDLCMASAMSFQQHHEYRTILPLDDIIAMPRFFLNVAANLRIGDKIALCRYNALSSAQEHRGVTLLETAEVRVAAMTREAVTLHITRPVDIVGAKPEKAVPAPEVRDEVYVPEECEVRKGRLGKPAVVGKVTGKVYADCLPNDEVALAIAGGSVPVPVKAAA